MTEIFVLLIVFQIKHYWADFKLQNEYMLGKFKEKDWIEPLAAHAGVHALFTFFIVLIFTIFHQSNLIEKKGLFIFGVALILFSGFFAAIDFIIHFIMDRIKASPKLLGRFEAISKGEYVMYKYKARKDNKAFKEREWAQDKLDSNKKFWESLGLDQKVHHLTHYLIIYTII